MVRAVRHHLPDLHVATESTSIATLVQGVLDGRFDAAFTRTPLVPGLESRRLTTEPVCAVLPEGHPLAGRDEFDPRRPGRTNRGS